MIRIYSSIYINNNGNITFNNPLGTYTPDPIGDVSVPIIAPFWADVDTRGSGSGIVQYGVGTVNGRNAFGVNWINVGYFNQKTDKLNSFQLILIDRSDRSAGAFDVEFNYDGVLWETGDASGGTGGLGGFSARAGYSDGTANDFELSGSGVNGAFLNSNSATGLIHNSRNSTILGRYVFELPVLARVTKVEYEEISSGILSIDTNPNAQGGRRIFPDKDTPTDGVDRRKIRVKAKYGEATAGVRIYFRNLDVDDPSANSAPIDPEPTAGLNTGNDNNGNVDGTANTKAGLLSIPTPNPNMCQPFADGISCLTDATGTATVDFTTTRQPGDNFTVVAGTDDSYISNLTLAVDGINLKDTSNVQIPVTTPNVNGCITSLISACRADMLTVWRRLHLEVDSMGNVGIVNRVTGTINGNVTIPGMGNGLNPGVGTVNINTPPNFDPQRFDFGRLVVGNNSFLVQTNTANSLTVINTERRNITLNDMSNFILYDDDDYNANDSMIQSGSAVSYLVDGDENEAVLCLPDSLIYLSDENGTCSNGTPQNMYAPAYIKPEYNWARNVANYNQTNLQFELNVEDGTNNATVINVVNRNRNSGNDEKDDFWIGYVLIGYQGPLLEDFDGVNPGGTANENARQGVSPNIFMNSSEIPSCDCYMSNVCPSGGIMCNLNGTPILPRGSFGSLIFQEVNQDLKTYFLLLQPPYTARTIEDIKLTIPHEIGHQFGLLGDQKRQTFKIMDYSDYINNIVNDEAFHPEHINIMRRRVKSPGQ